MPLPALQKWAALSIAFGMLSFYANAKELPVTLQTQDGWALAAEYQAAQADKPTVILLHDLNKNKEAFQAFKTALAKNDFGYLALDLRGHGQSTGNGAVRSFAKVGVDNQFNKMTRDVDAAIGFLKQKKVMVQEIILVGVGLGANVAAKATMFWPDVAGIGLISPAVNIRDVLAIGPMRMYKGNSVIAAGAADKKLFLEASVIRNVAYVTHGENAGKVTFLTAYDLKSHEMLDKYLIPSLIQWLKTPFLPEVFPDEPAPQQLAAETGNTDPSGFLITPSQTEEALVPSILGE